MFMDFTVYHGKYHEVHLCLLGENNHNFFQEVIYAKDTLWVRAAIYDIISCCQLCGFIMLICIQDIFFVDVKLLYHW